MFANEQIILRRVKQEDISVIHDWRNNYNLNHASSTYIALHSYEESISFVESMEENTASKFFIIAEKESGTAIGLISLINIDYKNRHAELTIAIGNNEFQGKGFGKESIEIMLHFAFDELNMHRVELHVFSYSKRAIQLYKKIGFKQEGWFRENLFRDGQWHDTILMAMLRKDYHNSC